jgi:uncharacterized protein
VIITCHSSKAQWYPDPMIPSRLVNDFAGSLTFDEADVLEIKLITFHEAARIQIVLVILKDFGRQNPQSYASTIIERWGVGYNNEEKGLLVLVKPKNQFGPLTVAIEPNSYLRESFDETVSQSIAENEIKPLLAKGRVFQALNNGTDAIISYLEGNYTIKETRKGKALYYIILLVLLHLIVVYTTIIVTKSVRRRRERKKSH